MDNNKIESIANSLFIKAYKECSLGIEWLEQSIFSGLFKLYSSRSILEDIINNYESTNVAVSIISDKDMMIGDISISKLKNELIPQSLDELKTKNHIGYSFFETLECIPQRIDLLLRIAIIYKKNSEPYIDNIIEDLYDKATTPELKYLQNVIDVINGKDISEGNWEIYPTLEFLLDAEYIDVAIDCLGVWHSVQSYNILQRTHRACSGFSEMLYAKYDYLKDKEIEYYFSRDYYDDDDLSNKAGIMLANKFLGDKRFIDVIDLLNRLSGRLGLYIGNEVGRDHDYHEISLDRFKILKNAIAGIDCNDLTNSIIDQSVVIINSIVNNTIEHNVDYPEIYKDTKDELFNEIIDIIIVRNIEKTHKCFIKCLEAYLTNLDNQKKADVKVSIEKIRLKLKSNFSKSIIDYSNIDNKDKSNEDLYKQLVPLRESIALKYLKNNDNQRAVDILKENEKILENSGDFPFEFSIEDSKILFDELDYKCLDINKLSFDEQQSFLSKIYLENNNKSSQSLSPNLNQLMKIIGKIDTRVNISDRHSSWHYRFLLLFETVLPHITPKGQSDVLINFAEKCFNDNKYKYDWFISNYYNVTSSVAPFLYRNGFKDEAVNICIQQNNRDKRYFLLNFQPLLHYIIKDRDWDLLSKILIENKEESYNSFFDNKKWDRKVRDYTTIGPSFLSWEPIHRAIADYIQSTENIKELKKIFPLLRNYKFWKQDEDNIFAQEILPTWFDIDCNAVDYAKLIVLLHNKGNKDIAIKVYNYVREHYNKKVREIIIQYFIEHYEWNLLLLFKDEQYALENMFAIIYRYNLDYHRDDILNTVKKILDLLDTPEKLDEYDLEILKKLDYPAGGRMGETLAILNGYCIANGANNYLPVIEKKFIEKIKNEGITDDCQYIIKILLMNSKRLDLISIASRIFKAIDKFQKDFNNKDYNTCRELMIMAEINQHWNYLKKVDTYTDSEDFTLSPT